MFVAKIPRANQTQHACCNSQKRKKPGKASYGFEY